MFTVRLVNRLEMPEKHVLVVEDDTAQAARIVAHLAQLFGGQGKVQVSVVPGAFFAYCLFHDGATPDLLILDHDLPLGNGSELLEWLKSAVLPKMNGMKTITFSGIPANNKRLMELGATHEFTKEDVIGGKADALMHEILGV